MSEGQFWFVMICLVILLDSVSWLHRRKLDEEMRRHWLERDADNERRHEEFMAAMGTCRVCGAVADDPCDAGLHS